MHNQKLFPLVRTNHMEATRAFYTQRLGWGITLEMPGYLQVHYGSKEGPELCFMPPEQEGIEPLRTPFSGKGVGFSIEVPNADRECERLKKSGVAILSPLENKPWGWRSFLVSDPSGVVLNFYHLIDPSPEFLNMLQT